MSTKRKIKIAIVEDDLFFNKSLTKYAETICQPEQLRGLRFEIKSFFNADDAINELADDLDIMVLDYHLFDPYGEDELNGADVFKAVREHCSNCTVIMISDQAQNLIKERRIPEGIDLFINKDINSKNRLGAILQTIFHEVRQRAEKHLSMKDNILVITTKNKKTKKDGKQQ